MKITWKPAHPNNYGVGRNGILVDRIVLHWIVGSLTSADATFANPNRLASANYGVGSKEIHQYVSETNTAWHAGNFEMNQRSIGIEHEGGPNLPISEETYLTSIELVADICRRYSIPCDRTHIRKHSEVSNSPTICPGTLDVDRIIREANKLLATLPVVPPTPQPVINDQTKILIGKSPLGTDFGTIEVGAIKSKLFDGERDLKVLNDKLALVKTDLNALVGKL